MTMGLKPLHDWIVIVPEEAQTRTAGGLYIPDTAKEKPEEGVVEAAGPGAYEEEKRTKKRGEKKERRFIATVVKPGDRVLYERYAGQTYKVDGEDRILVRERDVLGLIERDPLFESRSRPLQIPASTSPSSANQIVPVAADTAAPSRPENKPARAKKKAATRPAVKKKTLKKAVKKKTAKTTSSTAKPAKKGRKTAAKKTARKK
jgi:chaperonin GroES